ncbi:MAG: mechanosensitive ion channel [Comamonadaceae bacterium]|nr:mechanosensitive ion channel [Comamonadaceae bacterium]
MDYDVFTAALQQALGARIPQLLGALAILLAGWLLAVLARAGVRRGLALARLNERIQRSTSAPVQVEQTAAIAVFWLVLLATLVAVLNSLDLTSLSAPFAAMVQDVVGYLPYLAAGAVLALVAWLIASVLRALATRALAATSWDERLAQEAGMAPISRSAGNVVFWLVILFFLPAILAALRLQGVLDPVRDLLARLLGYLPDAFGAAVIAVAGYVVARILRALTRNLLTAAGAGRINTRLGLDTGIDLPHLGGTVVFILVIVPSLIAALDALKVQAISAPATRVLEQVLSATPNILAAALILLLTWYVARFAAQVLARLLESAGVDALPAKLGLGDALSGSMRPSALAGTLLVFFALLFATVEAASQLGFHQVSDVVTTFITFGGDILLGSAILAVGFWLSGIAARAIRRTGHEGNALAANVARFAILGLVTAMGLRAMGIANEIVQLAFGLTLGAIAVAVALAFGLGGREAAGALLQHWVRKLLRNDGQ